jgi:hypothetical protein
MNPTDTLSKQTRGLVIGLLVLAILNLPLPFWNCYYGFSAANLFSLHYYGRFSHSSIRTRLNTIAGLGLAFGFITLSHGLFGLIKVTVYAMDLDGKVSLRVRRRFLDASLCECVRLDAHEKGRDRLKPSNLDLFIQSLSVFFFS